MIKNGYSNSLYLKFINTIIKRKNFRFYSENCVFALQKTIRPVFCMTNKIFFKNYEKINRIKKAIILPFYSKNLFLIN